jgi:hypothetical protein
MQRARRHDPYPLTWELPTALTAAVLLVLAAGVHAGRAVANLLAGAGWTWPDHDQVFTSLPAVLSGQAGAGLAGQPRALPGPLALWASISLIELVLVILLGWLAAQGLHTWGPRRVHGMASRAEAERLLGRVRLRRAAPVIRPDLYRPKRGQW